MDWDAIGAIGQMLGAAAVFISLGYLAVQLKTANLTARHASLNAFISDYNRYMADLYLNPGVVELVQKGAAGGRALLDRIEQERFHLLMTASHFFTLNMHVQSKARQFDNTIAVPLLRYFAAICKTKGGREWWSSYKLGWNHESTAQIDALIADPNVPSLSDMQPWWGESGASAVNKLDR